MQTLKWLCTCVTDHSSIQESSEFIVSENKLAVGHKLNNIIVIVL